MLPRRRLLLLTLAWGAVAPSRGACGEDGSADGTCSAASAGEPYWPVKNGDMRRTGASAHTAPSRFSEPAWVFDAMDTRDTRYCEWPETLSVVYGFAGIANHLLHLEHAGVTMVLALFAMLVCRFMCPKGRSCLSLGIGLWVAVFPFSRLISQLASCGVMYQSPVIDDEGNIFISASDGWLLGFGPTGVELWRHKVGDKQINGIGQMPTPAVHKGSLYLVDGRGNILKMDSHTGAVQLKRHYCDGKSGTDSWSMGLHSDTVFVMGYPQWVDKDALNSGSGSTLYALDATSLAEKWRYTLSVAAYNIMPAVMDDLVVFSDRVGGLYCLELGSGAVRWMFPGTDPTSFTTGDAAIGPNGVVYVTANIGDMNLGTGNLRAHEARTGRLLWNRTFDLTANAAPVIFPANGGLGVVTGLGPNAWLPWPYPPSLPEFKGELVAVNATTGEDLWTFRPPVHHGAAAGSLLTKMCVPDSWSNAAVGGDGTVYAGWHGGLVFAIDGADGRELSRYDLGSAMQGEPALAPGMLVVASCNRMAVFRA